jgi:hypothetical protein
MQITQEVRDYVAAMGVDPAQAIDVGMKQMASTFREHEGGPLRE